MGVFDKRVAFKPFEYPDIIKYKEAINHCYWLVSEWNFTSDVQDFHCKLNAIEKNAIKNTLLAISQIEVAVKKFWTRLGETFPKPEFEQVGVTFGESEVRHSEAYSHLLQILGLNNDFAKVLEVPAIQGRVEYLSKYIKSAPNDKKGFTLALTLFSLFIENISLFSQFAIMKSFNKHTNTLKDVDNVIQATQKEESVHALLGVEIIKYIKKENPEWFDAEFFDKIKKASEKAFKAESNIIDWIFEKGELEFLSKKTLKEFIKYRFNESINMIGGEPAFQVDEKELEKIQWFNDEIYAQVNTDFFHKKPVTYSKKAKSIKSEDIF